MICSECGSDKVIEGPAYARNQTTCPDCGHMANREVIRQRTEEEKQMELPPLPTAGFGSPEEAAAHLKLLQKKAKELENPIRTVKLSSQDMVLDIPQEMVMMAVHRYTRIRENWQAVIADAKREKEYRNSNVIIMAHNHYINEKCSEKCRNV